MQPMYYIGLDVHKRTISYCVKDGSGAIHSEGTLPAIRLDLDRWLKTLPQPWTAAMEATVFTGWIYDHLQPHAAALKVAHPLMLRAIAAAKKKNDRILWARNHANDDEPDFAAMLYDVPNPWRNEGRIKYADENDASCLPQFFASVEERKLCNRDFVLDAGECGNSRTPVPQPPDFRSLFDIPTSPFVTPTKEIKKDAPPVAELKKSAPVPELVFKTRVDRHGFVWREGFCNGELKSCYLAESDENE